MTRVHGLIGLLLSSVLGACGSPVNENCQLIAGAYQLVSDPVTDPAVEGPYPWVLIRESAEGACEAVVAGEGFHGRLYDVTFSHGEVELLPVGPPAWSGLYEQAYDYHVNYFYSISLDYNGRELTGGATASVTAVVGVMNYVDTFGTMITLALEEPEPAGLTAPADALPWRTSLIKTTRPVEALAEHLNAPPGGWSIQDVYPEETVGVLEAELSFHGDWDSIRGQQLPIGLASSITDLAGLSLASDPVSLSVFDIGPEVSAYEMFDPPPASWGKVSSCDEGDCATLGCQYLDGSDNVRAGFAGQLDTTGMTEVVIVMRLPEVGSHFQRPDYCLIEVVGESGERLPLVSGGELTSNQQVQEEWVYEVSGQSRVGFSIEALAANNPESSGLLIVDRVYAR